MLNFAKESREMFIANSEQLLNRLDLESLCDRNNYVFDLATINKIIESMHGIEDSAKILLFNNIYEVALANRELFTFIRDNMSVYKDYALLSDVVLGSAAFIKRELSKIKNNEPLGDKPLWLLERIADLKLNNFKITVFFEPGCEMENIRAYALIHKITPLVAKINYIPENILDDEHTPALIRSNGFIMNILTKKDYAQIKSFFENTVFLKKLNIELLTSQNQNDQSEQNLVSLLEADASKQPVTPDSLLASSDGEFALNDDSIVLQHIISINSSKLDLLMNLVSELVISEAMVIQNKDLQNVDLQLGEFHKASRQLHKIINDVQDTVMSMRMVPLSNTFTKINKIVRNTCAQLGKDCHLEIIGEKTEVDRNIVEHIAEPLANIIRNIIDFSIELPENRIAIAKNRYGLIKITAQNTDRNVIITIEDDGAGFIHNNIVEDDIVMNNISSIGGTVLLDNKKGTGVAVTLKIPLTLAIIDGMLIKLGDTKFTIPIAAIKESFKATKDDLFIDPDGNEMIMVRGESYNVIRMSEFFNMHSCVTDVEDGIFIMLENNNEFLIIFTDELIGEQQIVVKSLPRYIKKIRGLRGCTLLGNGEISLIVEIDGFFDDK